jgi:hypothetical protein
MEPKKLPEFRLTATPVDEAGRKLAGFKWADPEVGQRHKIGGTPDFQQRARVPRCPSCGEEMTFYAQLDSIGDDLCLADCGMIFVFVCFGCFQTSAFLQSG